MTDSPASDVPSDGSVSPLRRSRRHHRRADPAPTGFTLRESSDVMEIAPYLLGFHPRESLVLVGLDTDAPPGRRGTGGGPRRIGVVARLDLTDALQPGMLTHTLSRVARDTTSAVVALAFRDGAAEVNGGIVANVIGAADALGVDLADLLVVGAETWFSLLCDDPDHCSGGRGHRRPDVPSATALRATVAGMVARPDRSDVVGLLAPDPGRDVHRPALEQAEARRAEAGPREAERRCRSDVRALFAACRALPVLDDTRLVRFGAALMDRTVLDACWLAMEDGRLDGEGLWRELGRRLPSPFDAPPLFLAGWTQWRCGNGTLAGVAAEQALASDPSFAPAELLMTALSSGLDPFRTPRVRRGA